jgi:hypothetical protein
MRLSEGTWHGCAWRQWRICLVAWCKKVNHTQEALGERRDEGDLDQQVEHGFGGSKYGRRVTKTETGGKEPTSVERTDAQDQRLVPRHINFAVLVVMCTGQVPNSWESARCQVTTSAAETVSAASSASLGTG